MAKISDQQINNATWQATIKYVKEHLCVGCKENNETFNQNGKVMHRLDYMPVADITFECKAEHIAKLLSDMSK